ncbi:MAG: HypC/HybG/HupF family hydrogenase formation chaperone [Gemmatimonadota bacterium]|nr:HypC/HybG/HupF family hydrogenase formation chaperone [Gemmatimonadota bacterium]
MSSDPARSDICVPAADRSCSICGDEAAPAVVESIDATTVSAEVRDGFGTTSTVALDLLDGTIVGDTVMVHLGFAIGRVPQASAATRVGARVNRAESVP